MPPEELPTCFCLTEYNSYANELWHFYVPVPGNEKALCIIEEYLTRVASIYHASDLGSPYAWVRQEMHLPTLSRLRSSTACMQEHQTIKKLDLDKILAQDWSFRQHGSDRICDPLYEGGLRNFRVPE